MATGLSDGMRTRHPGIGSRPDDPGLALGWAGLLGLAAGLAAFAATWGIGTLIDPPPGLRHPPGDVAMALAGATAFATDAWRWPVFAFDGLSDQHPTNAIFTDSWPLLALAWKLLPGDPLVQAPWALAAAVLASFLWQGAAGAMALRLLGVRRAAVLAAGAAVMALMPIFVDRTGLHLALAAQGFVLLALGLLLAPPRPENWTARQAGWAALLVGAVLTHAYLLAMAGAAWALSLIAAAIAPGPARVAGPRIAAAALAIPATVAAVMAAGGYFHGAPGTAGGFGHYGFDLAAPLAAAGTSLLPGAIAVPGLDAETYAYVPVATLALVLLAAGLTLARRGRPDPTMLTAQAGGCALLLVAAAAALVFAGAGRLSWAGHVLADLPLPDPVEALGDRFRTTARFAWPVIYALVLLAIARIARGLSGRAGTVVLLAAAVGMAVEMRPLFAGHPPPPGTTSGDPALVAALEGIERIAVQPQWACFRPGTDDTLDKELQWLAVASGAEMAHSLAAARLAVDCRRPLPQDFVEQPAPGALLIVRAGVEDPAALMATGVDLETCRQWRGHALCRADWPGAPAPAAPVALPEPVAAPADLALARDGAGVRLLGRGLSAPEPWGTWTVGERATVELTLAPDARPGRLGLQMRGFVPPERPGGTTAEVILLGKLAADTAGGWTEIDRATARFSRQTPRATVTLDLPDGSWARLRLAIEPQAPLSPAELGLSDDRRRLGVGLETLKLER